MAPADTNSPSSKPEFDPVVPTQENPFLSDVCRTPWHAAESVQGLNADVLDQLVDVVGGKSAGPMMLLTAPRAGYGKTHLLGRVAAAAADQAVIVPVAFRSGDPLTLASLSRRGIESLADHAASIERPGWSRLREASAQIVAQLLRRLIVSSQIACANPSQAAGVLSGSVQEVFDESGSARRIGLWISQNRESLRGPLAMLAAREVPLRAEALDGWIAALLEQSLHGELAGVAEMQDLTGADNDTGVPAWLRLLSLWRPAVLLVDHLDGFYRHPDAGVKIASMLMELVESHRLHVLLSLNQDVWQATFGHHLPSALEDRLTASQVLLRGLTESDAEELLRLRLDQSGLSPEEKTEFEQFVSVKRHFLGRPIGSVSARAFLRHCARQWDIFQSSPPSPGEPEVETSPLPELPATVASPAPLPTGAETTSAVPLMTETVQVETAASAPPPLPALFDPQTATDVQTMAESLTEPLAALPQDDPPEGLIDHVYQEEPEAESPPQESSNGLLADPVSTEENSFEDWSSTPTNGNHLSNGQTATPTTDAFVKLREMLARLRQPGQTATPLAPQGQNIAATAKAQVIESPFRVASGAQEIATSAVATVASPFQVATTHVRPAQPPSVRSAPPTNDVILGRFQALRLQLQAEAMTQPLDCNRLADLIRLAGKRFPLVRYSEHELPGLTGRYVYYWALQGLEVLFGLAPYSDVAYWRTLSGFAAGRFTDLAAQQEREGLPTPKLKLVCFKTEREQLAWQNLLHSQLLPETIREITDIVHLDTDGLASLYAMQRIIKESETGVLHAEPAQIIGVLARELDFFWKRITRLA